MNITTAASVSSTSEPAVDETASTVEETVSAGLGQTSTGSEAADLTTTPPFTDEADATNSSDTTSPPDAPHSTTKAETSDSNVAESIVTAFATTLASTLQTTIGGLTTNPSISSTNLTTNFSTPPPALVNRTITVDANTTDIESEVNRLSVEVQRLKNLFGGEYTIQGVGHDATVMMWTATLIFFVMMLGVAFFTWRQKAGQRRNYVLLYCINMFSCIVYLVMAFGHGRIYVPEAQIVVEADKLEVQLLYRPAIPAVWYARYIGWMLTTPLMLFLVGSASGAEPEIICFTVTMDLTMLVCGLIATVLPGEEASKWMFWLFGMVCYLILLYVLLKSFRAAALNIGRKSKEGAKYAGEDVGTLIWIIVITWTIFPFVWITAEGSHQVTDDMQVILYAALDVISKASFTLGFLRLQISLPRKRSAKRPATAPRLDGASGTATPSRLGSVWPTKESKEKKMRKRERRGRKDAPPGISLGSTPPGGRQREHMPDPSSPSIAV
mmetsp:Transcript_1745/g.3925  ORF Transcript_1745/g.3925 Transcript_1745/m.3925 type:complete len:497 (+) Transcript_1745:20-1510(+)